LVSVGADRKVDDLKKIIMGIMDYRSFPISKLRLWKVGVSSCELMRGSDILEAFSIYS
jgi:hypothetical protein